MNENEWKERFSPVMRAQMSRRGITYPEWAGVAEVATAEQMIAVQKLGWEPEAAELVFQAATQNALRIARTGITYGDITAYDADDNWLRAAACIQQGMNPEDAKAWSPLGPSEIDKAKKNGWSSSDIQGDLEDREMLRELSQKVGPDEARARITAEQERSG